MRVVPVPVRSDNYAYLLIDDKTNTAAAVDPYDVPTVSAAADTLGVKLVAALTTHHHHDHSGGNQVSDAHREQRTYPLIKELSTPGICEFEFDSASYLS